MRNILLLINVIFASSVTFYTHQALADMCTGVTWQSAKASVDSCLAIEPCLDITEDSSASSLKRCRDVLPCHAQAQNTSDSNKSTCRAYQLQQGKDFYSDLYASQGQYTIAESGEMTIALPDNPDGTANLFVADKSVIGGIETSSTTFAAGSTYNNENDLVDIGRDDLTSLESGNDLRSQGYQTVLSIQNENPPLPMGVNDTIITNTATSINSIESDTAAFGNCIEVVDDFTSTIELDKGTVEQCFETVQENYISNGSCEVERKIIKPIKSLFTSGGFAVNSCGNDCLTFKVATENNELISGSSKCKIFSAAVDIEFFDAIGVVSAVVNSGVVDDHTRFTVGDKEVYSSGDFTKFEAGNVSCEENENTRFYNNLYFTTSASSDVIADKTLSVKFDTAVGGEGNHVIDVTVKFDRDIMATDEIVRQEPYGCYDSLGDNFQTNGYQSETYCTAFEWNCLKTEPAFMSSLSTVLPFYEGGEASCLIAKSDDYFCNPFIGSGADPSDEICFQDEVTDGSGDICTRNGFPSIPLQMVNVNACGCYDNGVETGQSESACFSSSFTWFCSATQELGCPSGYNHSTGEVLQEELCYSAEEVATIENNPCDTLVSRPECSVAERECMIEDQATGKCFNWRYSYECADPESYSMVNSHSRNICTSDIACAGGECDISETETNDDFINAMTQFSMLQSLGSDMACSDPTDPSTCTVWPGEYEYCSYYPVGNDCCEGPTGVNIFDYVNVISSMGNLDAQIMGAEILADTALQDGWQVMREPIAAAGESAGTAIANSYDAVTTSLSNAWNSLSGNITGEVATVAGETAGDVASSVGMDAMKEQMTQFIADLMPDAIRDAIFTTTAEGAVTGTTTLMSEATNVFSGVMAVYTAYQIANLVITLATQCDDNEEDAGLKIAMKQCVKVNNSINEDINDDGSTCEKKILGVCVKKRHHYCCYNTPLARIVIEQAIPLLNKTLDVNVDEMSCAGLSFADMQALDWSQIDLQEWTGLMAGAGLLPLSNDETSEEEMTGSGQLLNVHGRMTTSERMENRFTDDELSQRQSEIWNAIEINSVDCTASPSLPVCKYRSPIP